VSIKPDPALKQTPLFEEHTRLGGKMIGFGGWEMPVFYTGILDEHLAVRSRLGVFDISHMGQLEVSGTFAKNWLNLVLTNNIEKLAIGEGQYTFLLNREGGVIDDLIVYRRADESYFLVVNAAKTEEDVAWLEQEITLNVELNNVSAHYGALAVQGPKSAEVLGVFGELPNRNHMLEFRIDGVDGTIARTGYTGEDGFELFFPAIAVPQIWNRILELGKIAGIRPCGLGARDTLRMEVCYPLNGSDLSADRTPIEAGLGFFVDLEKPNFLGREALLAQKESGPKQKFIALKAQDRCPPLRSHYPILIEGRQIGEITSGTQSPTLGAGIGLGYVDSKFSKPGQRVQIDIRGKKFPATIEKKPLYKRPC
jgi:aminomethyltransferase